MPSILYLVPTLGVFALLFTWLRAGWVARQDAGDAKMQTIAGYIALIAQSRETLCPAPC